MSEEEVFRRTIYPVVLSLTESVTQDDESNSRHFPLLALKEVFVENLEIKVA